MKNVNLELIKDSINQQIKEATKAQVLQFAREVAEINGMTLDEIFTNGPSEEETRDMKLEAEISALNKINHEIARLKVEKEQAEEKIKKLFDHNCEGQKTYYFKEYAVEVKTNLNYVVDKKEYEVLKGQMRKEFNPIKEVVKYEVDKKKYEEVLTYGSQEDIKLLSEVSHTKPAKLSVTIKPNTKG